MDFFAQIMFIGLLVLLMFLVRWRVDVYITRKWREQVIENDKGPDND
jgi:hypothetical protein